MPAVCGASRDGMARAATAAVFAGRTVDQMRHFDTTFTAQVGAGRAASRSLMHTQKGTLAYTVPFYPVALNGAGTSTRIYGDVAAGSGMRKERRASD